MNLQKAEQSIVNGVYAAVAWLVLDFGLLFQQHGVQTLSIISARLEMAAGAFIVIICIVGLFYKSRLAAIVLFLLFVVPLILRLVQGEFPSAMLLLFSLILLYFFLAAVLGTLNYHNMKDLDQDLKEED